MISLQHDPTAATMVLPAQGPAVTGARFAVRTEAAPPKWAFALPVPNAMRANLERFQRFLRERAPGGVVWTAALRESRDLCQDLAVRLFHTHIDAGEALQRVCFTVDFSLVWVVPGKGNFHHEDTTGGSATGLRRNGDNDTKGEK